MLPRPTAMFTLSAGLLAPATTIAAGADEQVQAAYAAFDAAFAKTDAKAIGAMYTDDALFLPATHDVLRGPAAIERFFEGLFAAGVTAHKLELIEAHGTPDLVVAAAKWSVRTKDGTAGGVAANEFVRRDGGDLKLRLHIFN